MHVDGEFLSIVLGVDLGAQLVAGGDGKRTIVIVEAEERREAPATLDAVELQVDEIAGSHTGRTDGLYIATVIAVVVVGTDTDSSREVVVDLTDDVDLIAIDVLLALHVGEVGVLIGHDAACSEFGADGYLEHGDTLVVLYETTATHDADHR